MEIQGGDNPEASFAPRREDGTPSAAASDPQAIEIDAWVDSHADVMFRYAVVRVRDQSTAEDLVQEAFLAAWQTRGAYRGDSSERTWLIGILRHKIIDHLRRAGRERVSESLDTSDPEMERLFDAGGRWKTVPGKWNPSPSELVEREEFWAVLRQCVDALPQRLRQVFALRVLDGRTTEEICKDVDVSSNNVWVILHRARARLRRCLEAKWFSDRSGR